MSREQRLEHTVMELGAEIYRLRHQVSGLVEFQESFVKMMHALKQVLDEKGLVTAEDFEGAIDLNEVHRSTSRRQETVSEMPAPELKKVSH